MAAILKREDVEAYKALSAGAGVAVERELTDKLTGSLGVAFRYADIEAQQEPRESFALLSLPGRLRWDRANDRFSPTAGGITLLTAEPFVDLLDTQRRFFKTRLTQTQYVGLTTSPQTVLALRGSLGSIYKLDTWTDPGILAKNWGVKEKVTTAFVKGDVDADIGGLSVRDLAPMLGVSLATAKADWALARAWLTRLLHGGSATGPATA